MARIVRDADAHRFVAELDEGEAYIDYRESGDVLDLTYIYVSPTRRGEGIEDDLVRSALAHAREEGYSVAASCPWIHGWMARNPE